MGVLDPIPYPDETLARILRSVHTIALVGASPDWNRPSYFVMKYLQGKGFRVIPVNPAIAGTTLLGERVYAGLREIPDPVDMVDIFRASRHVMPIVEDAIAIGARVVWMQLGVRNDEAAAKAEAAGLEVVMNRCPKIEYGRLAGELSWSGVNSGIMRNRPPEPPTAGRARPQREAAANRPLGFETRTIHAGAAPDPTTGARATPIYQTTSYVFEDVDHAASLFNLHNFGYIYSRLTNPTVSVLEERVASLEGGRAGLAAASGHAAQFLIFFTLLEPGDEFLASRNLYGGSLTQFGLSFPRLGWTSHFVDPRDPENFARALTPRCKAIFVESLANPGGIVVDLEAIAAIAHGAGIPLIVDNTLASPFLCRPIEWGADLVCHSTTKFLSGHGNALGGVIVEFRKIRLERRQPLPFPHRARARLSRAPLLREFRRLRLHHQGPRGSPSRLRAGTFADERLPHHHRHRDAARAHGAACRERGKGGPLPGGPSPRLLGLLCRARLLPLPRARAQISPARGGRGDDVRCGRRLRGGDQARRKRAHLLASGEYRRHAEPHPPSRLDDAPAADRRAARGRRRRARRGASLGRARERRRPDRRPRPGARRFVIKTKGPSMSESSADRKVLTHIQELVAEEELLYAQADITEAERARLSAINVALDQCWDLLRQRRSLREFGKNPDEAKLRPAGIVEKYEG